MVIWLALACTFITPAEQDARRDLDGDGYASVQWGGSDCDDNDPAVNPGRSESCNGVDDDCDGQVDVLTEGGLTRYLDADGDGYGGEQVQVCEETQGFAQVGEDCDDTDASINPGATETCGAPDEDCDGLLNEEDPSLDLSTASVGWQDGDGDGFGANGAQLVSCEQSLVEQQGDCDDGDAEINPEAEEICDTDTDEDCDGDGACSSWTIAGPLSGFGIGDALTTLDLNQDALDDLILGMPSDNQVGSVWGPALEASALDQSFEGSASTGRALDAAPGFRSGASVVLVGGDGEALLMVGKVSGATLRMKSEAPGFGGMVQLLSQSTPKAAVGATGASGGEEAVFLFDARQSGNVEQEEAAATLRLGETDQKMHAMLGLDHDGDGAEDLAVALERDGTSPESVLLLEPWTGEAAPEDAAAELGSGKNPIAALGRGDFDGDGRGDLALGVPSVKGNKGEVLVFFGPISSSKLSEADLMVEGDAPNQALGAAFTAIQTPETADLLVVSAGAGGLWVLDLQEGALLSEALWSNSYAPTAMASGDVDGDGWGDLILGFPNALGGEGQVRVSSGQAILGQ